MRYMLVRLAALAVLCAATAFGVERSKIRNKRRTKLCMFLACTALVSIFFIFPPEKWLMRFDTPEAVFDYMRTEERIDTVEGKNSALVLGLSKGSLDLLMVPMRDGRYLIPDAVSEERAGADYGEDKVILLYREKSSGDLYFFGFLWGTEIPEEIGDSFGGSVRTWEDPADAEGVRVTYFYGAVPEETNGYYLVIGGEKVALPAVS